MKTDRVLGVVLFAAASFYLLEARSFGVGFIADPIGPRAFPNMIGILVLGLSSWLSLRPGDEPFWPTPAFWRRGLTAVASLLVYASVLNAIGFVLATTLLLTVLSLLSGGRLGKSATFAFVFSSVVYFGFRQLLAVSLPVGSIFLRGS